jgi:hypothetical protein
MPDRMRKSAGNALEVREDAISIFGMQTLKRIGEGTPIVVFAQRFRCDRHQKLGCHRHGNSPIPKV